MGGTNSKETVIDTLNQKLAEAYVKNVTTCSSSVDLSQTLTMDGIKPPPLHAITLGADGKLKSSVDIGKNFKDNQGCMACMTAYDNNMNIYYTYKEKISALINQSVFQEKENKELAALEDFDKKHTIGKVCTIACSAGVVTNNTQDATAYQTLNCSATNITSNEISTTFSTAVAQTYSKKEDAIKAALNVIDVGNESSSTTTRIQNIMKSKAMTENLNNLQVSMQAGQFMLIGNPDERVNKDKDGNTIVDQYGIPVSTNNYSVYFDGNSQAMVLSSIATLAANNKVFNTMVDKIFSGITQDVEDKSDTIGNLMGVIDDTLDAALAIEQNTRKQLLIGVGIMGGATIFLIVVLLLLWYLVFNKL
jgi:hypothetical protein